MKCYLNLFNKCLFCLTFTICLLLFCSYNPVKSKALEGASFDYNNEFNVHISYTTYVYLNQKNHPNYSNWLDKYNLNEPDEYGYNELIEIGYYNKINKEIIDSFKEEYNLSFNSLSTFKNIYKTESDFKDIIDELDGYKSIIQLGYVESIYIVCEQWAEADTEAIQ